MLFVYLQIFYLGLGTTTMRPPTHLWVSEIRDACPLVVVSNSYGINKEQSPSGTRRQKQFPS